jgi:hypothetical protein
LADQIVVTCAPELAHRKALDLSTEIGRERGDGEKVPFRTVQTDHPVEKAEIEMDKIAFMVSD